MFVDDVTDLLMANLRERGQNCVEQSGRSAGPLEPVVDLIAENVRTVGPLVSDSYGCMIFFAALPFLDGSAEAMITQLCFCDPKGVKAVAKHLRAMADTLDPGESPL